MLSLTYILQPNIFWATAWWSPKTDRGLLLQQERYIPGLNQLETCSVSQGHQDPTFTRKSTLNTQQHAKMLARKQREKYSITISVTCGLLIPIFLPSCWSAWSVFSLTKVSQACNNLMNEANAYAPTDTLYVDIWWILKANWRWK